MKKWIVGLIFSLVILGVALYVFIPKILPVTDILYAKSNHGAAFRALQQDSVWQRCWPGTSTKNAAGRYEFDLEGYTYFIKAVRLDAIDVSIVIGRDTVPSIFAVVPENNGTVKLSWTTQIQSGRYPTTKIKRYFIVQKLRSSFKTVLAAIKTFIEDVKNVYGFPIRLESVKTQYLMANKSVFDHAPTVPEIYSMIDEVYNYISVAGAKPTGNPMLNIHQLDSLQYQAQVGIPVEKRLTGNGRIYSKWMMKGGDILTTEVSGGNINIDKAIQMTEKYISDNHITIIAIPFQSLVTNRLREPDSTKWKTVIYYPVVL